MIALVRHASYNPRDGRLTADGRVRITELAKHLVLESAWQKILASPTTRTKETAEIIAEVLACPCFEDERLTVMHPGSVIAAQFESGTIYVTHYPLLRDILPDWDPNVGEAAIVDETTMEIMKIVSS